MAPVGAVDSKGHLKLREDPEAWIKNNPASRLALVTSLKLDSYPKEEIGESIGELTHLIRLEFWFCRSLKRVPNAITRLHKLEHLLFLNCECLEELPANIGDLVSLTHLSLYCCKNIKYLPNSIVNLSNLTSLDLFNCKSLVKLPENIGQLASLTHLQLDSCDNIKSLPMSVANLPKLTSLSLSSLSLSELPSNLGDLKKSLTGLDLYDCNHIKFLPNSIVNLSNLTSLSLDYCESLVELPADMGQLASLTHLKLSSCRSIKSLPMSIANLSNLTSLSLKLCESLTELPSNLGQMKSLSHLELNYCNKIKSLPDSMKDLCSLDTLLINDCNSLTHLPINLNVLHLKLIECCPRFLPTGLINLKYLRVTACSCSDESFVNWKDPCSLQHLSISSCYKHSNDIITLPACLNQFVNLQVLSLHGAIMFDELPANLDGLAHLCLLDIQDSIIKFLPWSITKLRKLQHVMLPEYFRLETLQYHLNDSVIISVEHRHVRKSLGELKTEIGQMPIHFGGGNDAAQNPSIITPPGYLQLKEDDPSQWIINNRNSLMLVRFLDLEDVVELTDSIMQFSDLTHLYLRISHQAKDFGYKYLVTLTRLAHLSLDFRSVKIDNSTIHSLSKLSNLQTLHLCLRSSELFANFNMPVSLKHLSLSYCKNMKPLYDSLEKLTNLKTLDLNSCVYCESLPPSMYLDKLRLIDCSFKSLDSLPIGLHHLEILVFYRFNRLESVDWRCMFEESWNQLVNLETLSITCSKMEFLPEDIARLSNLQKLQLKDCVSLEKLPSNLHELVNLHTLDISVTGIKTLPLSFVKQFKLQHLILPKCFNMHSLPEKLKKVSIIDDTEEAYYKRKGYDASLYQTSADSFDESEETELGVVPRESCNEDNNVVPTVELHEIVPDEPTFADPFNSTSTCYIGHITTEQGGVSQIYKDSHSYVSKDPIDENLQHTAVYPQNQFNPLGNGGLMTNLPGAYSFGVNNQHAINDGQIGTMTFGNAHEIAPIFQHISSRGGNSFIGAWNNDHALEFGRNNNTSQSYDADAIRQGRGITPEATLALLPATNMRLVDAAENLDVFCSRRRENSNPECESIPAIHTDQNDIMTTEIEQGNGDNNHHDSENEQNQIPQNNNVKGKKGKQITLETLQPFWSKNMTMEEAANKIGNSQYIGSKDLINENNKYVTCNSQNQCSTSGRGDFETIFDYDFRKVNADKKLEGLTGYRLKYNCSMQSPPTYLISAENLDISLCVWSEELLLNLNHSPSLRHLAIKDCKQQHHVKELPANLNEFSNLQTLYIRCSNIESPPSFIGLQNLQKLYIGGDGAREFPSDLDKLDKLVAVDIHDTKVRCLPLSVTMLQKLRFLFLPLDFRLETLPCQLNESVVITVDSMHIRKTWKELRSELSPLSLHGVGMEALQNSSIFSCPGYLRMKEDPEEWIKMNIDSCEWVQSLELELLDTVEKIGDTIWKLSKLNYLYISGNCHLRLKHLPDTSMTLRHLSLQNCNIVSLPHSLGKLSNLKSLCLDLQNSNLPDNLDLLVNLRHLSLHHGKEQSDFDNIAKLSNLKALDLFQCDLELLPENLNIAALKLSCSDIRSFPTSLHCLEILHDKERCGRTYCDVTSLYLEQLINVQKLSVTCYSMKLLPSIERLQNLQELQLKDCSSLEALPNYLGKLVKLCILDISGTRIKSIPNSITKLSKLEKLILPKCFQQDSSLKYPNKGLINVIIDDIVELYFNDMSDDDDDDDDDNETSMKMSCDEQTLPHKQHAIQVRGDPCYNRGETSNPSGECSHAMQNTFTQEIKQGIAPTCDTKEIDCGEINHCALESEQNYIPQSNNVRVKIKRKDITLEMLQPFWSNHTKLVDAAEELGVKRSTLKRRIKELNVIWPRKGKKQQLDAKKRKLNNKAPFGSDCSQQNLVNLGNSAADHAKNVEEHIMGSDLHMLPNHVSSNSDVVINLTPDATMETIRGNLMETIRGNLMETIRGNLMDTIRGNLMEIIDSHQGAEVNLDGANEHTLSDTLPQNEKSSNFIVKATYKDDIARVEFNLSKSIDQLKEEVGKRLDIEASTFKLKYEDEEKDWIVMACTADLEHALNLSRSSNNTNVGSVVRLLVVLKA